MNVLILIVSFTIVGVMFVLNFRDQTKDIFLENAESKINQNKVLIEYISDTVVNLSRQVFRNQKFNRLITTEFTSEMPRYEARTEAVKILEPQQQAFQYIESLVFVGEDGFSVGAPVNQFLDIKENEFHDQALSDMAWENKSEYICFRQHITLYTHQISLSFQSLSRFKILLHSKTQVFLLSI